MLATFAKLGFDADHPGVRAVLESRHGDVPPDIRSRSGRFPAVLELITAMIALCAPITAPELRAWFAVLIDRLRTAKMTPAEILEYADNFVFAFEGFPRFLFDQELQREVVRSNEFLPMPARIAPLIQAGRNDFELIRQQLNRILNRAHTKPLVSAQELKNLVASASDSPAPLRLISRTA